MSDQTIRVLFVCLGNICRSPLAEGAFRRHVEARGLPHRFHIDSSGTSAYHVGDPPDIRSVRVAHSHKVDISGQRSRQIKPGDLQTFDYIVAMDRSNLRSILNLAHPEQQARVILLLDETDGAIRDVPDPYYGGVQGFDRVWSLVDGACRILLDRIARERC